MKRDVEEAERILTAGTWYEYGVCLGAEGNFLVCLTVPGEKVKEM